MARVKISDYARYKGISASAVYKQVEKGKLIKDGKYIVVDELTGQEILEFKNGVFSTSTENLTDNAEDPGEHGKEVEDNTGKIGTDALVISLQKEVESLKNQLEKLEKDKEFLQGMLALAMQQKQLEAPAEKPGFFSRIFRKKA